MTTLDIVHTAAKDRVRKEYEDLYGDNEVRFEEFFERMLVSPDSVCDQSFPELTSMSPAFFYNFQPVPEEYKKPEFLYVRHPNKCRVDTDEYHKSVVDTSMWNILWETGHIRHAMFEDQEYPSSLAMLKKYHGSNVFLIPEGRENSYYAYAPLYHLIPSSILIRNGLPCLPRGIWPSAHPSPWMKSLLPIDFDIRLQSAFAQHIWQSINSSSSIQSFSENDSIKILTHNLDFWLPSVYEVAHSWSASFGRCDFDDDKQKETFERIKEDVPENVSVQRPLHGGILWSGKEESEVAIGEILEVADKREKFRAIVDAIKSNRVEDDFSDRWSYEKEDFERKLYRKRDKIKVKFVELDETIPVHAPTSEVHDDICWQDFMSLLNPKEREIVVLLKNGPTRLADVAETMGYANHSPISKALSRIRNKTSAYFE